MNDELGVMATPALTEIPGQLISCSKVGSFSGIQAEHFQAKVRFLKFLFYTLFACQAK